MPVVGNTASVSQQSLLDTARQRSSIPMAASELPKHQQGAEADVWMYPSQQQFFNAMKRKVCMIAGRQLRPHSAAGAVHHDLLCCMLLCTAGSCSGPFKSCTYAHHTFVNSSFSCAKVPCCL
jgi:hypothetical protein